MQSLTTTPLLSLLTFDLKVDFAWLIAWESVIQQMALFLQTVK